MIIVVKPPKEKHKIEEWYQPQTLLPSASPKTTYIFIRAVTGGSSEKDVKPGKYYTGRSLHVRLACSSSCSLMTVAVREFIAPISRLSLPASPSRT